MQNYQATVKLNAEKPYAALRKKVVPHNIPKEIPPLVEVLSTLLSREGIAISGDCFFRYLSYSNDNKIELEVGFPIENRNSKSGDFLVGSFPHGKYLSVIHTGDYKRLMDAGQGMV